MLYDRKIKYLDYYESGSRVNGGGFAKLEVRDNILRIELTIRGLHPTDSFERDIVLLGAEKEETLGQIRIQNGCGQFRYSCGAGQEIGATGIFYNELRGIRVSIGGTREILCQWDNISDRRRVTPPEENPQNTRSNLQEPKRESIAESCTDSKTASEAPVYTEKLVNTENEQSRELKVGKTGKAEEKRKEAEKEECKNIEDKDRKGKNKEEKDRERQEGKYLEGQEEKNREGKYLEGQEEKNREGKDLEGQEEKNREGKDLEGQEEKNGEGKDLEGQEEKNGEGKVGGPAKEIPDMTENNRAGQSDVGKAPVKLMEDKWQQLSAIYPHIQPFRDERDYLSLTPSDFVLFPNRFYRAVNNSFLLHGYYNYHHLILARIERRGETLYYIGVPGNYFEREKQVAVMFGFESFECEREPAKTGDFGYYMMRTEL